MNWKKLFISLALCFSIPIIQIVILFFSPHLDKEILLRPQFIIQDYAAMVALLSSALAFYIIWNKHEKNERKVQQAKAIKFFIIQFVTQLLLGISSIFDSQIVTFNPFISTGMLTIESILLFGLALYTTILFRRIEMKAFFFNLPHLLFMGYLLGKTLLLS